METATLYSTSVKLLGCVPRKLRWRCRMSTASRPGALTLATSEKPQGIPGPGDLVDEALDALGRVVIVRIEKRDVLAGGERRAFVQRGRRAAVLARDEPHWKRQPLDRLRDRGRRAVRRAVVDDDELQVPVRLRCHGRDRGADETRVVVRGQHDGDARRRVASRQRARLLAGDERFQQIGLPHVAVAGDELAQHEPEVVANVGRRPTRGLRSAPQQVQRLAVAHPLHLHDAQHVLAIDVGGVLLERAAVERLGAAELARAMGVERGHAGGQRGRRRRLGRQGRGRRRRRIGAVAVLVALAAAAWAERVAARRRRIDGHGAETLSHDDPAIMAARIEPIARP